MVKRVLSSMVSAVLATAVAVSAGASPGVEKGWTLQPPMNAARAYPSATTLADGRALVVGGYDSTGNPARSAEIFDPADRSWTATTSMLHSRARHAAVHLVDGRVLVVGGEGVARYETAEIYDPSSEEWTPAGKMSTPRMGFAAVRLTDGRVLVAGGKWFSWLNTVDIFDPATGIWSPASPMAFARSWGNSSPTLHATLLNDGRVLVAPASDSPPEIYDPVLDVWTQVSPPPSAASLPYAVVVLPNGHVLGIPNVPREDAPDHRTVNESLVRSYEVAVRHVDNSLRQRDRSRGGIAALVYDPTTDAWRLTQPMAAIGTLEPVIAALPSGAIIVVGSEWADDVQTYDLGQNAWTKARGMAENRAGAAGLLLADGGMLLLGGMDASTDTVLASSEVYSDVPFRDDARVEGAVGSAATQGETLVLRAHLAKLTNVPMPGRELRFYTPNGEVCRALTNSEGDAECGVHDAVAVAGLIADGGFTVRFRGDTENWPASSFAALLDG